MDFVTALRSPAPAVPRRRLYRRPDRGLVGGVCVGIAEHVRLRPRLVRIIFAILVGAGGMGLALYGAYWIVLPTAPDAKRSRIPTWLEYVLAIAAGAGAVLIVAHATPIGGLFVPTMLACLGGALIWRQATDADRGRWRKLSRDSLQARTSARAGRLRTFIGAALVLGGGILVLVESNFTALRDGFLLLVVALLGLALLTGPWWMGLVTALREETSERIRSQERADIAAHLHDSVLQTLALIQRNSSSQREVSRLARGQERELRTLLYGERTASGQLADELRRMAAEVEDAYAIGVEVVIVGDAAMTEHMTAATAAAREALVNAAKHSGVTTASLYAEVEPSAVSVFVKDRGVGFELDDVADDRQGVRGSITGRVERHGGDVKVRTQPGSGTEVEIRMPR
jgi:signal transduction histidine kinase/phage shock protein PspC (stress-responsive transcriptional regulator)